MRKTGDKAIKKFIKHYDKSAYWVIQSMKISPNTLYRHPGYPAALVKRAELQRIADHLDNIKENENANA